MAFNDRTRILAVALMLVLFVLVTRHVLAPVQDYTIDDWFNLVTAESHGYRDVIGYSLRDVYRPIYNTVANLVFKAVGDNPLALSMFCELMQSLLVLAVFWFVWSITGSARTSVLSVIFFIVIPITNEVYHCHTSSLATYAAILYLVSLSLFQRYLVLKSRWISLFLAILCYGIAIFSYEYGVFIAPLYFILSIQKKWRLKDSVVVCSPIILLASLYLLWRFTKGFGYGVYMIFNGNYFHNQSYSIGFILQNIRQIAGWWFGLNFWSSLNQGLAGFQTIMPKYQFLLIVLNTLVIGGLLWAKNKLLPNSKERRASCGIVLILISYILMGYFPYLLTAAHSRHNLFPSVGVCALIAMAIRERYGDRLNVFVLFILIFFMVSSQGISKYWHDDGMYHRRIYNSLANSHEQWCDAEMILIDSSMLRQRLSPGLFDQIPNVEYYGPSVLPRSWVYGCMLKLHYPSDSIPLIALDQEYGARWKGDMLHWHARFDPGKPRNTMADRIAVFDAYTLNFTKVVLPLQKCRVE